MLLQIFPSHTSLKPEAPEHIKYLKIFPYKLTVVVSLLYDLLAYKSFHRSSTFRDWGKIVYVLCARKTLGMMIPKIFNDYWEPQIKCKNYFHLFFCKTM